MRPRAALLVLALLAAVGCQGRREEPVGETAPPPLGTIRELKAESSITTDVNARAPAFARNDSKGTVIRTQDAIGRKVLLLDFWSVFCQSCLQEIPFLQGLHRRYGPEGLEIVGVNTDFFPQARIEKFMAKTGLELPYRLILDRDQSLSRLFSVEALPVLVLIDSSGWIRMVHLGYRPADEKMVESRVRQACGRIKETLVTLQPVQGRTAFAPAGRGERFLAPGDPVPAFAFQGPGEETRGFEEFRGGGPALIFFWSLFCQPCRAEFERLDRLGERHGARGLKVLAVNIDSPKLKPAALRFLASQGKGFTAAFDRELERGRYQVAGLFGVNATPSTFLVGRDGRVLEAFGGEASEEALAAGVGRLLAGAEEGTARKGRLP